MFFKMCCGAKEFLEKGVINKRVGGMTYMLKGKEYEHQSHINHLRPRYTENIEEEEVPMEVLYDMFNISTPLIPITERCNSKRKRKRVEPFSPDPKRKRYLANFRGKFSSSGGIADLSLY